MRILKAFGLALVAALALSAMAASGASANTAVVTGGSVVHGSDAPKLEGETRALTGAAGVECGETTYTGTAVDSTITVGLTFGKCFAGLAPATVTDNGCSYKLTLGALEGHSASAVATLECPVGKQVEVHVYQDAEHKISACTIEIPAQHGLTGLTVKDETNGHLLIHGTVGGITNYLAGHCATTASGHLATTINPGPAELHAKITVTGGLGLATEEEEE